MTSRTPPRLANRLRVARAERDLSQTDLAESVDVSRQTISSIETGQYTPSALLAFRLAAALRVPVAQLFWIEGDER
ncbi:MAG: helix-turn-helix transcriptional regulator [Chloroflexi bacterium]|nr:helix-turn-helix transcriptional regulator [Chloroflexota bacterium]